MVLPMSIGDAAQEGDRDTVIAWLDAGGSINDIDEVGSSLVYCCTQADVEEHTIGDGHVALARHLIALGADVNAAPDDGFTPLHEICQKHREPQAVLDMMSLLLGAGANVNARDHNGDTPLYWAIQCCHSSARGPSTLRTTMITELLRAGASVDGCADEKVDEIIQKIESNDSALAGNEHWRATKRLVYRAPHRDVLAVRGLAQRGKLSTNDSVLNFLARLGDNGVVWHVLEYWRATN